MAFSMDPGEAVDFVIVGATGDLALRKLLPALLRCFQDGRIAPSTRIAGVAIDAIGTAEYRRQIRQALPDGIAGPRTVDAFLARVEYFALDAMRREGWENLKRGLQADPRMRVFYLATSPGLFAPICERIAECGLIDVSSKVVLEKPLGHDLGSAVAINNAAGALFAEHNIFRIDHYLGKEAVQNLTALRFGNTLFEPVWNSTHIDHVQITVAENGGIEGRGAYYTQTGALRDMVQNHLLQLLCLVAMEPPVSVRGDALRDEKVKVLRALEPVEVADVEANTVRGCYHSAAPGIRRDASGASPASPMATPVETFVAIRVGLASQRWRGVPFYLRTGKRMASRLSEIVVAFRPVAHAIFGRTPGISAGNRLVLRLQPDEGVKLWLALKEPGPDGIRLRRVPLDLSFSEAFGSMVPDAYERLLVDIARGNPSLFMCRDEVESAWSWIDSIVDGWQLAGTPLRSYAAGSWGPAAAAALMSRDGRQWHEDWMRAGASQPDAALVE